MTRPERPAWRVRGGLLDPGRSALIMGVVNVTPDSFSDGGKFFSPERAAAQGRRLREEGAHIIDVGGASTRPGAEEIAEAEELRRVTEVVRELAEEGPVSIDTSRPRVAEACLEAGAAAVNDVTALAADGMARVCGEAGAGVVLMHMQGDPRTMQLRPRYGEVVTEVRDFLRARAAAAEEAGVDRRAIVVDPGIGFGKTLSHNLELLAGLGTLAADGLPVAVGVSRKSFLGRITGRPVEDRDTASAAAAALAVRNGASVIRTHNAAAAADAAAVAYAMVEASGQVGEGEDDYGIATA